MQTICKEPDKYILINTLEANMQKCLIKNTININDEEMIINSLIKILKIKFKIKMKMLNNKIDLTRDIDLQENDLNFKRIKKILVIKITG